MMAISRMLMMHLGTSVVLCLQCSLGESSQCSSGWEVRVPNTCG